MESKKIEVLIVDDEQDLREVLRDSLLNKIPNMISNIYLAENGRDGILLAKKHRPSLIVSDYNMPKLNGLEFLKSLYEEGLSIPVIWTTGYGSVEIKKLAWRSGVYEVFDKPIPMEEFLNVIKSVHEQETEEKKSEQFSYFIDKHTTHAIRLSIPENQYKKIIELSEKKCISITTLINELLDNEIKKAS